MTTASTGAAFNPYEDTGGGVGTEGQINVDSGIFNSSGETCL